MCLGGTPALCATYYVDFEGGSDAADGLSPSSPWKRAPGDSRAGAGPRNVRLQPGDRVLFRGGVAYRGTIVVRAAGTQASPIRYVGDEWGPEPAVLDGAEPIADARPCRSARDCGGAAEWHGLYRLSLAGDSIAWDGIFQQKRPLRLEPGSGALRPGTAKAVEGSNGRTVLVRPLPGTPARFASGAGRVGVLFVAGGHVEIRGFEVTRFLPAPRFGPYAGLAMVQLQPMPGVRLAALHGSFGLQQAPPIGPSIAGVTSGPI